jgi:hypothetical protein
VHQFSPRLINDYNMGFFRVVVLGANTSDPTGRFGTNGNSLVGLGNIPQPQNGFTQQSFTKNNRGGLTNLGSLSTGTTYIDNTFSYTDTLTYQLARHTIKAAFRFFNTSRTPFIAGTTAPCNNRKSFRFRTSSRWPPKHASSWRFCV